jgi:hypothetical protein
MRETGNSGEVSITVTDSSTKPSFIESQRSPMESLMSEIKRATLASFYSWDTSGIVRPTKPTSKASTASLQLMGSRSRIHETEHSPKRNMPP